MILPIFALVFALLFRFPLAFIYTSLLAFSSFFGFLSRSQRWVTLLSDLICASAIGAFHNIAQI